MEQLSTLKQIEQQCLMNTYARQPVVFTRGEGVYLYDTDDRRYLDMLAGIAVCGLGHAHPAITEAIHAGADTLLHVSNLYYTRPVMELAAELTRVAGMNRVFFCNSGAEANECALKIARKRGKEHSAHKTEIVCLRGGFHGRLFGSLSVTAQPKYQRPFEPLVPDVRVIDPNEIGELREAVTGRTCAVILEPMQGESGVHPVPVELIAEARRLCDRMEALLIFDEVQTGNGRTGSWYLWQQLGVQPDVLTTAKGLGSGLPIGACLAGPRAAEVLQPGDHGSTFAGGPLVAGAALATIHTIEAEGLCAHAAAVGNGILKTLRSWHGSAHGVTDVRGRGLMIGFDLDAPIARAVVSRALELGLVINATGDHTVRLLPPLILTAEQADEALTLLSQAIQDVRTPA